MVPKVSPEHASRCFDIGTTTRAAIRRWMTTGDLLAGSAGLRSADNGIADAPRAGRLPHRNDRATWRELAGQPSRMTPAFSTPT
jgi:hypothetical protein